MLDVVPLEEADTEGDLVLVVECVPDPDTDVEGVVVLDNSDWDSLQAGITALTNAGFRRLDFFGLGPMNSFSTMTSVFYRPGSNCLEI